MFQCNRIKVYYREHYMSFARAQRLRSVDYRENFTVM